jgi:hypothetical protein
MMDSLTVFGVLAVSAMMIFDTLEKKNRWFTLCFAASCIAGSTYGFLQGAWPFGVVEAIWAAVKVWHFSTDDRPLK